MKKTKEQPKRLRWPQIRYDRKDILQVEQQLGYAYSSPSSLKRAQQKAKSPLFYLGIIGGWQDEITAVNAGLIVAFLSLPQYWYFWSLSLLYMTFRSYGTRRALKLSLTRFHLLRIFRAPKASEVTALVNPIDAHFRYLVDYANDPISVAHYKTRIVPQIDRLTRTGGLLTNLGKGLYITCIGAFVVFAFTFNPVFAEGFVYALYGAIICLFGSVTVFLRIEDLRALVPPAWFLTDLTDVGNCRNPTRE